MARRVSTLTVVLVMVALFATVLSADHALYFRDHATVFRRLFAVVRAAYRAGELPLWDPLIGGGEPLAAYPAAVAFSPLHLITVLAPLSWDPYDLFVVSLYAIAAGGGYVLAATLGLDARARLTAMALFACSGPMISLNNLVPALHSAAFGPWALAAALMVWRQPSARPIAALALALGLHAHGIDPALLVCDALVFLGLLPLVTTRAPFTRRLSALVGAAALGLGFAMIQILPLLDLLRGTARAQGYQSNVAWSMHPLRLFELSFAGLAGDFLDLHTLFQPHEQGRHYLASVYLSALALPGLALALGTPQLRRLAIIAMVCLALALGPATPLLAVLNALVPGTASSRFPVKYVYGAALALPIVVPLALQRMGAWSPRRLIVVLGAWLAGAALLAVAPASWVMVSAGATGLDQEGVAALLAGASSQTVLISALVLVALALAQRRPAWGWALPIIVTIDVALAAYPVIPTMPPLPTTPSPVAQALLADDPVPTIFRYDAPAPQLDMATDTRRGFEVLEPMGASPFGIRTVLDIDLNDIRSPAWNAVKRQFDATRNEGQRLHMLARLGVTHLLVTTRQRHLPLLSYVATATVANNPPVSIFRIEGARPAASFVSDVVRVDDLLSAARALTATVGPQLAVVDDVATATYAVTTPVHGGPNAWELDAAADGVLVLTRRYDRGWHARIDGVAARVIPVDAMLLGVPVSAGHHRVDVVYAPSSVTVGAWVSVVSTLLLLALALRRPRARSGA